MLTTLRGLLTPRHIYPNPIDQQRAILLVYFCAIYLLLTLLAVVAVTLPAWINTGSITLVQAAGMTGLIFAPLTYILVNRGRLRSASFVIVAILVVLTSVIIASAFDSVRTTLIFVPLAVAAYLFDWRGLLTTLVIQLIVGIFFAYNPIPLSSQPLPPVYFYVLSLLTSGLILFFSGHRLAQLSTSSLTDLGRLRRIITLATYSMPQQREDTLISQTIETLSSELGYPFARVYLLNDQHDITRLVYSGLGVEQQERNVGAQPEAGSALLDVIRSRQVTRIDLGSSEMRRNHFFPGTRAGLLLPLLYGDNLIGLLDVQTVTERAFNPEEQEVIALLAAQLAGGLAHGREIDSLRTDIKEQQDIILKQRDRLRQLEQADQRAVLHAWTDYLTQRGESFVGYDIEGFNSQVTAAEDLPELLRESFNRGEMVVQMEQDAQRVSIPIALRGQVLGAVSFTLPGNRPITRRQQEMIGNVVQRLSLALDNKRLFEQSQAQAQRESKANEVAAQLLTSTDVETVLRMAAQSFNDALGAIQTRIHLAGETLGLSPSQPEEAR